MRKTAEMKSHDTFEFTPTILYLFLYNAVQALGWTSLAVLTAYHFCFHNSCAGLYDEVKVLLTIFQTLALLEVVHAAIGIVRSNPVLTAFQLASRVFLVWCILNLVPESGNQIGVLLVLIAWIPTEIIRYSYYMMAVLQSEIYLLQRARYTLFYVLYPLGVTGELLCFKTALPYIRHRGTWSILMPNAANMSFDYYSVLIVIMISYIPIFPQLYCHMIAQRRKVIGGVVSHAKRD